MDGDFDGRTLSSSEEGGGAAADGLREVVVGGGGLSGGRGDVDLFFFSIRPTDDDAHDEAEASFTGGMGGAGGRSAGVNIREVRLSFSSFFAFTRRLKSFTSSGWSTLRVTSEIHSPEGTAGVTRR